MKKLILVIAIVATWILQSNAQELVVTDFNVDLTDMSAQVDPVLDINDVPCALIKVGLTEPNAEFDGDIIKIVPKSGEYWVYLVEGSTYLTISTPNFTPLRYDFDKVNQKLVYIMTIKADGNARVVPIKIPGTEGVLVAGKRKGAKEDVEFNMILVDAGMFKMGATEEQKSQESDEKPAHWVKFSNDFYIGETEVTQQLWDNIMGYNNSYFQGPNLPIENVSYAEVLEFINKLNTKTGLTFRLPTESEWEYAARGANKSNRTRFAGSENLDEVGWWYNNSSNASHPVKSLAPNELGLYDMSGNVWELCQDYKGDYPKGEVTDYVNTSKSKNRVRRGGAWDCDSMEQMRCAYRRRFEEDAPNRSTGFRLVLELF